MPVLAYSPSHTEIQVLERLTTGAARHRLIDTLVEAVRSEVGRKSHQHQLLIGPRGSGKTHALTLVAHRLRTNSELQSHVLPIVLAEEEVASHPADLMKKVLEKLAAMLDAYSGLEGRDAARRDCRNALACLRSEGDDERALEIAAGTLEGVSAALGRLLVTVIENLDSLLYSGPSLSRGTAVEGQWGLRRVLLETRGILVLGAAPSLFGEVTDPQAPFYDFFRCHYLDELKPEEMLELIRSRLDLELENDSLDFTRADRLQSLSDHFESRSPRLRGLLVLTGGLPRFAHLIFDLLTETDLASVTDTLSRFLDEQTPYFQSRLDPRLLPKAELEVLDVLASAEGPLTPKEIAARLRAPNPNAVATFLKRLRERGLIRPVGTSRHNARYDVTEPLFRVWRRFRHGRTEQDQVVLLAEFVAAIFDQAEMKTELESLTQIGIVGLRRIVLETALTLTASQPAQAIYPEVAAIPFGLSEDAKDLIDAAEKELLTGSLPKAFTIYTMVVSLIRSEGPERALPRTLSRLSDAALLIGDLATALGVASEAEELATLQEDDLERAHAIRSRGEALFRLGGNQHALDCFKSAESLYQSIGSDLGRANAVYSRGEALFRSGKNQQAMDDFILAESIYETIGNDLGRANAIRSQGKALLLLGKSQQALDNFDLANALYKELGNDLGLAYSIRGRGQVQFRLGKSEQALQDFNLSISLCRKVGDTLGIANAVRSRGHILAQLGEDQQALDDFKLAESLYRGIGDDLGRANCWFSYGRLIWLQGKWKEGLDHLLLAFQLAQRMQNPSHAELIARAIWTRLLELGPKTEPTFFQRLLRQAGSSLLSDSGMQNFLREQTVRFAIGLLFTLKPEPFFNALSILEAALPTKYLNLLRPLRLAAEILAGRRLRELPEESEEMRRAVQEVFVQLEERKKRIPSQPAKKTTKKKRLPKR